MQTSHYRQVWSSLGKIRAQLLLSLQDNLYCLPLEHQEATAAPLGAALSLRLMISFELREFNLWKSACDKASLSEHFRQAAKVKEHLRYKKLTHQPLSSIVTRVSEPKTLEPLLGFFDLLSLHFLYPVGLVDSFSSQLSTVLVI